MPDTYAKKMVYLSEAQYQELISNNSITVNGQTITYSDDDIYVTPQPRPILDVQINGSSIKSGETANIPVAANDTFGTVKVSNNGNITLNSSNRLAINFASEGTIKGGSSDYASSVKNQHVSAFYGLAKASGDTTQSQSSNAVGQYTDEAKASIQRMLGVTDLVAAEEFSTATAAHAINSTFMMDGKLYRATSAIAIGDAVVEGQNCEVVKIEDVYATKKDTVLETTLSRGRKDGTTVGEGSFAFGSSVEASGNNAHAEGGNTVSSGLYSHAEGSATTASIHSSHAEGNSTTASGTASHAEGYHTTTSGYYSHAEGAYTTAQGIASHAEGLYTVGAGRASHAAGKYNIIDSYDSWPEWTANTSYSIGDKVKVTATSNNTTIVTGYVCKTANSDASFTSSNWQKNAYMNYATIVGNGDDENSRSNAYTLDWEGNGHFMGDVYVGANADSSGGTKLARLSDVQINGTSIISSGVANIPYAPINGGDYGLVKPHPGLGTTVAANGGLSTVKATEAQIKSAVDEYRIIAPINQHTAVFYGLAKAAGDTSQASSNNAVGTYTAGAKTAIKQMIGINVEDVQVNSTSVVSNGIANINLSNYATTTDTTAMDARITTLEAEITSLRQALQSMLTPANAILTENNDVLTDEQGNPIESDVSSGG